MKIYEPSIEAEAKFIAEYAKDHDFSNISSSSVWGEAIYNLAYNRVFTPEENDIGFNDLLPLSKTLKIAEAELLHYIIFNFPDRQNIETMILSNNALQVNLLDGHELNLKYDANYDGGTVYTVTNNGNYELLGHGRLATDINNLDNSMKLIAAYTEGAKDENSERMEFTWASRTDVMDRLNLADKHLSNLESWGQHLLITKDINIAYHTISQSINTAITNLERRKEEYDNLSMPKGEDVLYHQDYDKITHMLSEITAIKTEDIKKFKHGMRYRTDYFDSLHHRIKEWYTSDKNEGTLRDYLGLNVAEYTVLCRDGKHALANSWGIDGIYETKLPDKYEALPENLRDQYYEKCEVSFPREVISPNEWIAREEYKKELAMYRPDTAISCKDMNTYGFSGETKNPMFPVPEELALKLYRDDTPIYLLDGDNQSYLADHGQQIKDWMSRGGMVGITYSDNLGVQNHEGLSAPKHFILTDNNVLNVEQMETGYEYTITKEMKCTDDSIHKQIVNAGTVNQPLISTIQAVEIISAHRRLSLAPNHDIDCRAALKQTAQKAPSRPNAPAIKEGEHNGLTDTPWRLANVKQSQERMNQELQNDSELEM